jgi:hypothetical protein
MGAITVGPHAVDPLGPNSVKAQDGTRFLSNGGVQKVTTITYWLGRHGPFELVYPQGQWSAVDVNNAIHKQRNELSQVLGVRPGG